MITDPLHDRSTATFPMAQTPLRDDHFGYNSQVYVCEDPYSDPALYEIHPIETSSSVAPQNWGGANGESSHYAHPLPPYWVTPVVTNSIISLAPLAHVTPSSSAPAPPPLPPTPTLAPPLPPPTQTPANGHRLGTQKEVDLIQLEQDIISSPWYAANAVEPPCGSPDCPHTADCYGVRGMSCYTAFVIAQPVGTFGCWRCHAYSARKLEDAVKHQRSNHFNHKPYLCIPTNGSACGKRFFSHADLQNHRRRCH